MDRSHILPGCSEERSRILDEIQQCNDRLITLKRKLYTLHAISLVPQEILCEIFLYYTQEVLGDDEKAEITDTPFRESCRRATELSHVCSYWRNITTSFSQLWAHLTLSNHVEWTELMLHRTQQAPLFVRICGIPLDKRLSTGKLILASMDRIESLHIHISAPDHQIKQFADLIHRDAPLLRTLSVSLTVRALGYHGMRFHGVVHNFPRLSQLSLTTSSPEGAIIMIRPPLESLCLCISKSFLSSLLLSALGSVPLLRSLELREVRFSDTPVIMKSSDDVVFKHLQVIRIKGVIPTMTHILKHVQIPENTAIELSCLDDIPRDAGSLFSALLPKLCCQESVGSRGPFEVIRVSIKYANIKVEGWRNTPDEFNPEKMSTLLSSHHRKLNIDLPSDDTGEDTVLSFFAETNMTGLKTLLVEVGVDCDYELMGDFWTQVFRRLSGLRTLYVADAGTDDTVQELLDPLRFKNVPEAAGTAAKQTSHPQKLLPQLTSLILKGVKFRNRAGIPSYADAYSALLRVCRTRRRGGIGLQSLSLFNGINIEQGEVQALKRAVTEVVWDHSVTREEPDESDEDDGDEDGEPYDFSWEMETYYSDNDDDDYGSDYDGW